MWDKYIRDIRIELERLIKAAGNEVYWWILIEAQITFFVKRKGMTVTLPIPKIFGKKRSGGWSSNWKEHNEKEIAYVRGIWDGLYKTLKEKLDKVDAGQSTVEAEFKEGILFENGKYGLKYFGEVKILK